MTNLWSASIDIQATTNLPKVLKDVDSWLENIKSWVANASKQLTWFDNNLTQIWKSATNVTSSFSTLRNSLLAIGALSIFSNLLSQVNSFERSMVDVKNASWAWAEAVKWLSDSLKRISNETGISRKNLADMSVSAIKLGIDITKGTKDIEGFIKSVVKVQALQPDFAGGNADEAANIIAKLNNILGNSTGQTENLVSSLGAVADAGTSTVDQLSGLILRFGAFGKKVGASIPELNALAGTLVDLGLSQEVAGTAVNQFFWKINTNADDFVKVIGRINPAIKDTFQKEIATNWVQALQTFSVELSKLSTQDQVKVLEDLWLAWDGSLRSLLALWTWFQKWADWASIFGNNLKAAQDNFKNVDAFNQKYLATLDTTQAKLQFVSTKFTNLWLDIVEKLIPTIVLLAEFLTQLFNNSAFQTFFDLFTQLISGIVAGVAWTLLPILSAVGAVFQYLFEIISQIVGVVSTATWVFASFSWVMEVVGGAVGAVVTAMLWFSAVTAVINWVRTAVLFLNAAFLANPIWAIILWVIALLWWLYIAYQKNFWWLKDTLDGFFSSFKSVWLSIKDIVFGVIWSIKTLFESAFTRFVSFIQGVFWGIQGIISWFISIFQWNFLKGIQQIATGWYSAFTSMLSFFVDTFVGIGKIFINFYIGFWKIVLWLGKVFLWFIKDIFQNRWALWTRAGDFLAKVISAIPGIIWAWLSGIASALKEWFWAFVDRWKGVLKYISEVASWAIEQISSIFSGKKVAQKPIQASIQIRWADKSSINDAKKQIQTALSESGTFEFTNTNKAISELWDTFSSLFDGVKQNAQAGRDSIASIWGAIDTVSSSIAWTTTQQEDLNTKLDETAKGGGKINDSFKEVLKWVSDVGKSIEKALDTYTDRVKKFSESIKTAMSDLSDSIKDTEKEILKVQANIDELVWKETTDFASQLFWDKAEQQRNIEQLQAELEKIKIVGVFDVDQDIEKIKKSLSETTDSEAVAKLQKDLTKLNSIRENGGVQQDRIAEGEVLIAQLNEATTVSEKEKINAQLEILQKQTDITSQTKDYLNVLLSINEAKVKSAEIDATLARNVQGSWLDLASIEKEASLTWIAEQEAQFQKNIWNIQKEGAEKLKVQQDLLTVQQWFEDALLQRRFLNEQEFEAFKKWIQGSTLDETVQQEAIKLAEKLKIFWDEKREIDKIQQEIETLRIDAQTKIQEAEKTTSEKNKKELLAQAKEIDALIQKYVDIKNAKDQAFWVSTDITAVQATTPAEPTAVTWETPEGITGDTTTGPITPEEKDLESQQDIARNNTTQDTILAKITSINAQIRVEQRTTTDQQIVNMAREIVAVQKAVQAYYALSAAKRAAWFMGGGFTSGPWFATGGFTWAWNISDVAWVVHKGEYVIPNKVLKQLWWSGVLWILENMRRWFADGGPTSGLPANVLTSAPDKLMGKSNVFNVSQTVNSFRDAQSALQEINSLYRRFS